MARIQVNEKDSSWFYNQRTPSQLVVLVPGIATFGPYEPTLVSTELEFTKIFGDSAAHSEDISYQMARSFLKAGVQVVFARYDVGATPSVAILDGEGKKVCIYDTTKEDTKVSFEDKIPEDLTKKYILLSDGDSKYLNCQITSKYNGAGAQGYVVTFNPVGDKYYRLIVKNSSKNVVDDTLICLSDPSDPYWYEAVNEDLSAVTVKVFSELEVPENVTLSSAMTYKLSGGQNYSRDYVAVKAGEFRKTVSQNISSVPVKDICEMLSDPLFCTDFNIIVDGGYNDVAKDSSTISTIDQAFTKLATSRGTCIYLVDGAPAMDSDEFYSYAGLPSDPSEGGDASFNTSYCAAFGPWCYARLESTGSYRELPGSYALIIKWAESLRKGNPLWMPPVGVKRGSVSGLIKSTAYEVGSSIVNTWDGETYKVNPITRLKQYGYVIYGNNTLLHTQVSGASSMLQLFSVRVMTNAIKSQAYNISLSLQFDQIDDDLFAEFRTLMSIFMDQLKYDGALYDYSIVADRSNLTLDNLNSRTVPVKIMISPNPTAENFVIDLEISQAGVTFGDEDSTVATTTESI